jgi:hypothetical protein
MMMTLWPLGFGVGEEQGRQWWGSGDCVKGVGFPPLHASGKRSHSSLRLSAMNLGSRASYRHDDRGPLPTDLMATLPFKTLTGEASGTHWDQPNIDCIYINDESAYEITNIRISSTTNKKTNLQQLFQQDISSTNIFLIKIKSIGH